MTWLKLVEGYMPMQMISELAICILFFAAINFSLKKAGIGIPKFWAGVGVWIFIQMYLKYRIYPPIPFSVRAIYGTVSACGIFMWVSGIPAGMGRFQTPHSQRHGWENGFPQIYTNSGARSHPSWDLGAMHTNLSFPALKSPLSCGRCIQRPQPPLKCMEKPLCCKRPKIRIESIQKENTIRNIPTPIL